MEKLDVEHEKMMSLCKTNYNNCANVTIAYNNFLNSLAVSYLRKIDQYKNKNMDKSENAWLKQLLLFNNIMAAFGIEPNKYANVLENCDLYVEVNETCMEIYEINKNDIPTLMEIFMLIRDPLINIVNRYLDKYFHYELIKSQTMGNGEFLEELKITDSDNTIMTQSSNKITWETFYKLYNKLIGNIKKQFGGHNRVDDVLTLWNDVINDIIILNKEESQKVTNKINLLITKLPDSFIEVDGLKLSKSDIMKLIDYLTTGRKNQTILNLIKHLKSAIKTMKILISNVFVEKSELHSTSNDKLNSQWIMKYSNIVHNKSQHSFRFYATLAIIGLIALNYYIQNYSKHVKVETLATSVTLPTNITPKRPKLTEKKEIIDLWDVLIAKRFETITNRDFNTLIDDLNYLSNNGYLNGIIVFTRANEEYTIGNDRLKNVASKEYKQRNVFDLKELNDIVSEFGNNKDIIIASYKSDEKQGGSYNYEHKYKKYKLKYINYKNNL